MTCGSLAGIATTFCLGFYALLILETPFVGLLDNQIVNFNMRSANFRQDHTTSLLAAPITLGLWDENKLITQLQLLVSLSLALAVDEDHVRVEHVGSFFYKATIQHEGEWVVGVVNDENGLFLSTLNSQAQRFGAKLVLSHPAKTVEKPAMQPLDRRRRRRTLLPLLSLSVRPPRQP